jgi:putative DNA methylase
LSSQTHDREAAARCRTQGAHVLPQVTTRSAAAVLDCFAGGGAISLEALRLGCDTTAVDLNPVAHLIEKCVLEYPQRFGQPTPWGGNSLAEEFVNWATWVREAVEPRLSRVYPANNNGRRPSMYLWARTMECPNPACRVEIPLVKSFWLARNARRTAWVAVAADAQTVHLKVRTGTPPRDVDPDIGTVKASSVTCPACGTSSEAKSVRELGKTKGFGRRLMAVLEVEGRSRTYRDPSIADVEGAENVVADLLDELRETSDGVSPLPDEPCDPIGYRNLQNLLFGFDDWRSLFNDRQLYVLGTLCSAVRDAYAAIIESGVPADRARAITTYLGLCIDRIADYNSSFCLWNVQRETIAHTFNFQAVPMVWDYTEINPLMDVSGSWDGAVRWIRLAIENCSLVGSVPAKVSRGNAQDLPFSDNSFDAAIVDPPYYFSVMYSDLSDFFYVWLKRSIGFLYPELFATQWTPKDQEVIQNRVNPRNPRHISAEEFEQRLYRSLCELTRVVKNDGLVSIVFAHTDVNAWERLLRAIRSAGLVLSASWPMRSESSKRPTALLNAVLGSSVVLVCRSRRSTVEGFYDDVVRQLEERIAERLDAFEDMGLVGADYFVSAIGPAFEVFAQYSRIVRLSGEEVDVAELMVLARQAVARHAMRRLLGPESLAALDPESLFYLTWRWAYLTASIPADEAYKLEKAFDVDLGHLCRPGGFARQSGSNFMLLGPQDRKGLKLSTSPALIDGLHLACQLWEAGRRRELEEMLGATGMGVEPGFWSLARALAEILLDGDRERTMLLGLTGNREALAQAAARSTTTVEELTLFDLGSS